MHGCGSSRSPPRCRSRHPTLGCAFVLAGAAAAAGDPARDARRSRARGARARGRPDRLRAHAAAASDLEALRRRGGIARRAGARASRAAGRALRQRHAPRVRGLSVSRGGGGAEAGPERVRRRSGRAGDQLLCSRGCTLEDANVLAERRVPGGSGHRLRRRPAGGHLARHGRIAFGDEIEISQGAEIGRPSRLYARADGTADQLERVEVGGSAVVVARGEFRLRGG